MRIMKESRIIRNKIYMRPIIHRLRGCGLLILACFVALWIGKIYSINKTQKKQEIVVEQKTEVIYDDLKIREKESHIYSQRTFGQRYGIDTSYITDGRILCTCLEVSNISDKDKNWDDVLDILNCGFQSDTWAGAIDPCIGQQMNVLSTQRLKMGEKCLLWFSTVMLPVSFKQSTWVDLTDEDFYYVLSLNPEKKMIHLDIQGVE